MSNMCIEVEFLAGTSIEQAAAEAISRVNFWGIAYIKFNFNGIDFSVGEKATVDQVVAALKDERSWANKFAVING